MKRQIKLSSLSEGLRKEVRSLMKEGRTKLSQMPAGVRKRLVKESDEFFGTNSQEYDPNDAYRFGANAKKSTDRRWNTQAFHEDVFDGKYTLSKMYGEDTVDVIDNNDHTEEGGIYTFGSKEEAMDFIEKREGGNIEMVKESKMKNKKSIKLSSLSEGLRKQVKSLMKEGKTKLSQMPAGVRRRLVKESNDNNHLTGYAKRNWDKEQMGHPTNSYSPTSYKHYDDYTANYDSEESSLVKFTPNFDLGIFPPEEGDIVALKFKQEGWRILGAVQSITPSDRDRINVKFDSGFTVEMSSDDRFYVQK